MNELDELTTEVQAKETHEKAVSYFRVSEQYGYKFIVEVKKIRDERYYKELGYSSFGDYCHDAWSIDRDFMNERIRIADEFGTGFDGYSRQFGHKKSLLLSRMDEPTRNKAIETGIETEDGQTKTIDKATQREIQQFKKRAEQAEQDNRRLGQLLTEERDKEPKVIEKVPREMKMELTTTKNTLKLAREELEQLKKNKDFYELRKDDFDEKQAEKERKKLEWEADQNVLRLKIKVDKFLEDVAVTAFMEGAIATSSKTTKSKLQESVEQIKNFSRKMESVLNGRIDI